MHPDIHLHLAHLRHEERVRNIDRRLHIRQRPRPPSRWRREVAAGLVRLATRLSEESVSASPRRA
jgi:hypothetical protein